jgi:hypothetical protein
VDRKRLLRLLLLGAALTVVLVLGRRWPKEQTVHYVLGDSAGRVQEVDARWAESASASAEDWTREATFRYAPGQAPRVVTHEPKLPDGDYTVEIDIAAAAGRNTVRRRVTLAGGSTAIELSQAVPR